jgi:peptidoglycan-N-acetylglucosamine deacetylase
MMKTGKRTDTIILLTFDVEDWFQVENLRLACPPPLWSSFELRAERNTHRILDLLESGREGGTGLTATFFVLGWIAERLPHLVREIHARGHEVASHGYAHRLCSDCSNDELVEDLGRSKKLLEDLIGCRVYGYRAPNFSISDQVLKTIAECGYTYDSSYNSFAANSRYGTIALDRVERCGIACRISESFYELPISNLRFGSTLTNRRNHKNRKSENDSAGFVLPWGGGGYFRLIPPLLFNKGVRAILQRQHAFSFYLHPWEVDPGQPRIKGIPFSYRFRHYLNLGKTEQKLQNLIKEFRDCSFETCSDYLGASERASTNDELLSSYSQGACPWKEPLETQLQPS